VLIEGQGVVALTSATPASPTSPITTADDLAAAYLAGFAKTTREAYARDLRRWGCWVDAVGVGVLDAHRVHVDAWQRSQESEGAAPSTIARRLSAVAGFYAYALDEGLIVKSPAARVKRPRVSDESPRFGLDRDELRAMFDAADASSVRDAALVALLALNGLRISEALAADVTDLGDERGHRTLRIVGKGAKIATVPLAPRTAAAVDALAADRTAGPIFVTRSGKALDRHAAHKIVTRLARAAGIRKPISCHSFRHAAVTLALDAGVSLRDVQDLARHADPRTTRRYDRARHSLDRHATYALAGFVG
jgi:integrase/recombinase XerD